MVETAISEALDRAGYDTSRDEFHVACVDALRRSNNPIRAADDGVLRDALIRYLVAISRNMKGKPLGGGQTPLDAHDVDAPAERPTDSGGGGHPVCDAHLTPAPSPATPRDGDRDRISIDAHLPDVPPSRPNRDGAGHREDDAQRVVARPAREPSVPKRGLAAMGEAAKKLNADFHIGAVGMAVGEIRISSYERMIFAAGREKVLGRCLKAYVGRQAHVPADAKTRDIVPEELLGRMIAFSKYSSLHGIEYMNDTALLEQMEAFDAK